MILVVIIFFLSSHCIILVSSHKMKIFLIQQILFNRPTILQYYRNEVYRDPGKGKVITDFVTTTSITTLTGQTGHDQMALMAPITLLLTSYFGK